MAQRLFASIEKHKNLNLNDCDSNNSIESKISQSTVEVFWELNFK